jgi:hypothetical protein
MLIWHHTAMSGCEHMHKVRLEEEGDSQVATFACMQLNPNGALVPCVHSPNTHLEALYCHPLLTRSECRRASASTSKASAVLLEKPCPAPSVHLGRVDFAGQGALYIS